MDITDLSTPCVDRHGADAYREALHKIGSRLLSVRLTPELRLLVTVAFDDVVIPFSKWFVGGGAELLALAKRRASLPLSLISGVLSEDGDVDQWLLAAVAFLSTQQDSPPELYRRILFD